MTPADFQAFATAVLDSQTDVAFIGGVAGGVLAFFLAELARALLDRMER